VLRVCHVIPALGPGGAERVLADLTNAPSARVAHSIIAMTADSPAYQFRSPVFSLGLQRGKVRATSVRALRSTIRRERPSVVHGWLYHGCLATAFLYDLGLPIVWSIHNSTLSKQHSKWTTRAINRVCAVLSARIPKAIAYCAHTARRVHEEIGYSRERGCVIANGIEADTFAFDASARRSLRAELGVDDGKVLVGSIARYDPQKDFATVLEAFARFARGARAALALVGTGCDPGNAELQGLVRKFSVENDTILLGQRRDIQSIMSALDILVVGSAFGEALPMVVLEAAAVGLHVVTTDVGDTPDLMLDRRLVVPIKDPAALAAAMGTVQEMRGTLRGRDLIEQRKALVAQQHNLADMVARYDDLYQRIARDGG